VKCSLETSRHGEIADALPNKLLLNSSYAYTGVGSGTMSGIGISYVEANGMIFRGREGNLRDTSAEAVILLHGFPESSAMWEDLLVALCGHGYRFFAPDQRGYSPGARPAALAEYGYEKLVSDVGALADALGFERFHLIGHDWGSVVGWAALRMFPDRIGSWTAMSVPHVDAFRSAIANDADQRRRSRYLAFFMLPEEPERFFIDNDYAGLRALWALIPDEQVRDYLGIFSEPGALTAALNWYRANPSLLRVDEASRFGPVWHPTLMIWGQTDMAVGRTAVEGSKAYMCGPYNLIELDAGHWLVQEQPERVQGEILSHLKAYPLS
jgi:pimeloyl-ACP methyl ester carboxylesterase